ncbi:MAG: tetratricopeptide repeat protein [Cyclobacteriaceae bacterium]|jgi:Flp pilus assembly protein TadD
MLRLQFWATWPAPSRYLFHALVAVAIATFAWMWWSWYETPAPAIQWENYQQLESKPITTHYVERGLVRLPQQSDTYVLLERFLPSALSIPVNSQLASLAIISLSVVFLLSIISTFSRFWFLLSMSIVILFIVSLRLESLALWGISNKLIPVAAMATVVGAGLLFQFRLVGASLATRLLSFGFVMLAMAVIIYAGASVEHPFLLLAAQSTWTGMAIAVIAIALVAMEIPASLVTVISQSMRSGKNLTHVLVLTSIYLLNLALVYLDHKQLMEWSFIPLNYYFLFSVSVVLGLWGYHARESQYEHIMPAEPQGMLWYLSLMTVSFATLSGFFQSANDTVLIVMQDMILYSHLGFGIIFVLYVLANFVDMLGRNLPVHRVLYKPTTMPYFTFRLAGAIATFTFFAYSGWRTSFNEFVAGYFNQIADVHYLSEDVRAAEGYYQRSLLYSPNNYHARHALGSIYQQQLEPSKARREWQEATDFSATPEAYVNLAYSFERQDDRLESVLVLREGVTRFPENGFLKNALGLSFLQIQMHDSALYYFESARQHTRVRGQASINLISAGIKSGLSFPADSLYPMLQSNSTGLRANAVALATQQGIALDLPFDPGADTTLTVYQAALIANSLINQSKPIDTALLGKIERLAERESNSAFRLDLQAACADAYYQQGETGKAVSLLRKVAFFSGRAQHQEKLGLWALEQGSAPLAHDFFTKAEDRESKDAIYYEAVALTEFDLNAAVEAWNRILKSSDTLRHQVAGFYHRALTLPPAALSTASAEEKFLFALYRVPLINEQEFITWTNGLPQHLQTRAWWTRADQWLALDEGERAATCLDRISDPAWANAVKQQLLAIALRARDVEFIRNLQPSVTWAEEKVMQQQFYQGLLDQNGTAIISAGRANPFFEEGIVEAARELEKVDTARLDAYGLLVNALLYKPESVYLLKAYALQAARLGLDEESQEAINKLRDRMPAVSFNAFVRDHPEIFVVEPN